MDDILKMDGHKREYVVKIIYIFSNWKNGKENLGTYSKEYTIKSNASIRRLAIKTIESAFAEHVSDYEPNDKCPIEIKLGGEKFFGQGIHYDLRENGSVIFLNDYSPLTHDWSYSRLLELRDAGYISGNVKEIIVGVPCGLGSGPSNFVEVAINFLMVAIGVIGNIESALQLKDRIVDRKRYLKTKKIFKKNGLYSLRQIRELMDTSEVWTLSKTMEAFSVDRDIAVKILTGLGYIFDKSDNKWHFCKNKTESLEARKEWNIKEEKQEQIISDAILSSGI